MYRFIVLLFYFSTNFSCWKSWPNGKTSRSW